MCRSKWVLGFCSVFNSFVASWQPILATAAGVAEFLVLWLPGFRILNLEPVW